MSPAVEAVEFVVALLLSSAVIVVVAVWLAARLLGSR